MSSVAKKKAELSKKNAVQKHTKYKIATWYHKFEYFWTAPDDDEHLGLNRNVAELIDDDDDEGNDNYICRAFFNDDIVSKFITHSWEMILKNDLGTEPCVRAMKLFLTQNLRHHSIGHEFMKEMKDFAESIKLIKKIEQTEDYKLYKGEPAIIMESDDIEKIRKMVVIDKDGNIKRDDLFDRVICGMMIQTELRCENVHLLMEDDASILDLNKNDPQKAKHMIGRFVLQGANRGKHAKLDTVHLLNCFCDVHIWGNPECDVGACELYDFWKHKDVTFVGLSRSKKKFISWGMLKYCRRPMYIDPNNKAKGTYYSYNGCSLSKIQGAGARVDKSLTLSISAGTNTDIKNKKRRKTFNAHSFRLTGTCEVEKKYGDNLDISEDIKHRMTPHKSKRMYSKYAKEGELEKISAMKIQRQVMLNNNKNKNVLKSGVNGPNFNNNNNNNNYMSSLNVHGIPINNNNNNNNNNNMSSLNFCRMPSFITDSSSTTSSIPPLPSSIPSIQYMPSSIPSTSSTTSNISAMNTNISSSTSLPSISSFSSSIPLPPITSIPQQTEEKTVHHVHPKQITVDGQIYVLAPTEQNVYQQTPPNTLYSSFSSNPQNVNNMIQQMIREEMRKNKEQNYSASHGGNYKPNEPKPY